MMIARWSIDARFGHKAAVIEQMKQWVKGVGSQVGWTPAKVRLATGSVGALESTVQMEVLVRDLNELQQSWEKLALLDDHKQWGKALEPHVLSGSPRWEVFRVID